MDVPLAGFEHPKPKDASTGTEVPLELKELPEFIAAIEAKKVAEERAQVAEQRAQEAEARAEQCERWNSGIRHQLVKLEYERKETIKRALNREYYYQRELYQL